LNQLAMEFPASPGIVAALPPRAEGAETHKDFAGTARRWVLTHLRRHGPTSGEDLTDGMLAAGIRPPSGDDRNFGSVYAVMARELLIEAYGCGRRRKGNGTFGAVIWRVTKKGLRA
jgi:hypothetical protein